MIALAESGKAGPDIRSHIDFWNQHVDRLFLKIVPNPALQQEMDQAQVA